jgi:hypothetical protein
LNIQPIFGGKQNDTEDPQMADAADDRDLVAKSVRPVGPPPRSGEAMRRLADFTYPLIPDGESRCLSVGRGITLSGEVNSCDKLLIEGSVDAKLTNCRAIEIAESGLFKGSTSIDEAEIRGRFEGDLIVRNRLLIKATGRVSGTILARSLSMFRVRIASLSPTRGVSRTLTTRFNNAKGNCSEPT